MHAGARTESCMGDRIRRNTIPVHRTTEDDTRRMADRDGFVILSGVSLNKSEAVRLCLRRGLPNPAKRASAKARYVCCGWIDGEVDEADQKTVR
jgi:hypothetical protein